MNSSELKTLGSRPYPFEKGCLATTEKVIQAMESRRPKPRYYVTKATYMVATLRRVLPTRLLDSIMVRS